MFEAMPTEATKACVRDRLLATAARLFYENGYMATGINQVISEAGVAKASFYSHFRSKEDLLVAWLQQRHDEMVSDLRRFVSEAPTSKEKIRRVFEWLGNRVQEGDARHGCAFSNIACQFLEESCRVRELVVWHKSNFKGYLRELVQAHYLGQGQDEQELEQKTEELYVLAEGVYELLPIHRASWPVDAALRVAERIFEL